MLLKTDELRKVSDARRRQSRGRSQMLILLSGGNTQLKGFPAAEYTGLHTEILYIYRVQWSDRSHSHLPQDGMGRSANGKSVCEPERERFDSEKTLFEM